MQNRIYLGNDLVHWSGGEAREKHPDCPAALRFAHRVLHAAEFAVLERIRSLGPVAWSKALWGLWAAKEAVYKAAMKAVPELTFSPSSIQVFAAAEKFIQGVAIDGWARVKDSYYGIRWETNENFVHAVAIGPLEQTLVQDVDSTEYSSLWQKVQFRIDRHEAILADGWQGICDGAHAASQAVRRLACAIAAKLPGLQDASLGIEREILMSGRLAPPRLTAFRQGVNCGGDAALAVRKIDVSLSHDGPWSAAAVLPV